MCGLPIPPRGSLFRLRQASGTGWPRFRTGVFYGIPSFACLSCLSIALLHRLGLGRPDTEGFHG